jgi:hypothetical protein
VPPPIPFRAYDVKPFGMVPEERREKFEEEEVLVASARCFLE